MRSPLAPPRLNPASWHHHGLHHQLLQQQQLLQGQQQQQQLQQPWASSPVPASAGTTAAHAQHTLVQPAGAACLEAGAAAAALAANATGGFIHGEDIARLLATEQSRCATLREQLRRAHGHENNCNQMLKELHASARELEARRNSLRITADAALATLSQHEARAAELQRQLEARRQLPGPATLTVPRSSSNGDPALASRASLAPAATLPMMADPSKGGVGGASSSSSSPQRVHRVPSAGTRGDNASAAVTPGVRVRVSRPVGLPNRSNDCFWLAALQALRHTPGFVTTLSSAITDRESSGDMCEALARLMQHMEFAEAEASVPYNSEPLGEFRFHAFEALPASDGNRKLVQWESSAQRQQDTHEFLSQILDYLGNHHEAQVQSPREALDRARLDSVEKELTKYARISTQDDASQESRAWAKNCAYNLLYEYSMIQWAASTCRMQSRSLGNLFEGQRLSSVHCKRCGRYGASGAEPFTVEEVKLADVTEEESIFSKLGSFFTGGGSPRVALRDVLRESGESPAPEGYRCRACQQVGTSTHTARLFRLPHVLVLHVNRARFDGSRCEAALEFEQTLDLGSLGVVCHFGNPLDRNLEPCSTTYDLFATVFHRGPTARSGHYFAYVFHGGEWVRIDDARVGVLREESKATPMALELSEPVEGARVALLFYRRRERT